MTGGDSSDGLVVATVEFYAEQARHWRVLSPMTRPRKFHSLSVIAGAPSAAGGYSSPATASVERLNGTAWAEYGEMSGARYYHSAVNIPTGRVACRVE